MSSLRPSAVHKGQNVHVHTFAFLMFLIGLAVEVSRVARDTFFLQTAGADQIPLVYILFAFLMILASLAYGRAARRTSIEKLARITLALAACVVAGEWSLIVSGCRSEYLAYALFCSVEMFFIFVPLTVWAVANQTFKVEEGEKVLPTIATFGLIGTVVGGLFSRIATPLVGPYNALLLSCVAFAGAALFTGKLSISARSTPLDNESGSRRPRSPWSESIVKTLTFLAFPMWVLVYMIEYTYFVTMGEIFTDAHELSAFLSVFVTVCSLCALLVQLQITPWLVARFGVGATCFLYPASLAVAATSTLVFALFPEGSVEPGVISMPVLFVLFARFLDMALYQSIYESTVHVLYYAVPAQTRTEARALVGGIIFPASIACSGVVLMLFRFWDEPTYNIAFTSVVVGFLVLIMAMDIRPDYLRSLLTHADPRNFQLKAALLTEISHLSLNESRHILLGSLLAEDEEEAVFAATKLRERFDSTLFEDLHELPRAVRPTVMAVLEEGLSVENITALREAMESKNLG